MSDIQGLSQLATQGVLGVTGLAESVQGNVYTTVAVPFGPLRSALGQHDEAPHCLDFPLENQWTAYGANHMDLLKNPEVTTQVLKWLSA